MNFPDIPAGFFGPLLGSLDKIAAVASKTIPTVTDPRRRDLFAGLLDELQKSRAQFESLVIPEALETHRKLQESTSKSLELLEDHNALNDRMKEIRDEYAGTVAASKEFRQENPPKPLPPPAKPQWLPKKRSATAPLLDGKTLRSFLLGLRDPAEEALQGPHTTGNIWDNWKPGDTGGKPRA
jgi:hypothetical protein